jgi:chitodextrinase
MKKNLLYNFLIFICISIQSYSQTFTVDPTVLNFGIKQAGAIASQTFTVKNTSSQTFQVSVPNWDATYITSVSPRDMTINAGATKTFTVNVTYPNNAGTYSYKLWLTYKNNNYNGDIITSPFIELTTAQSTPPAPTNLSFRNYTTSGFTLNWSSSSGASGYNVYKNGIKLASTASLSYNFSGLSAGTAYTVAVSSYNNIGESSKVSKTGLTKPDAPTNIIIQEMHSTWCILKWDPSFGATSYPVVYRNMVSEVSMTNNMLTGLTPNTSYVVQIYSANSSGWTPIPSTITIQTPVNTFAKATSNFKNANLKETNNNFSSVNEGNFNPLEINDLITVYPNPAHDILYINGLTDFNIIIFDLNGRELLNKENISEDYIDISELPTGVFTVHIKKNDKTLIQKFVKQ